MAEVVRRAVQLAIQDGNVFVQDVTIAGRAAETALGGIGTAAGKASQSLHDTGDATGAMSGAMRQHLTQAGDDVNRLFDSINSGRSAMTALTIEVPKILDVFGNPWLTAAGIVVGSVAAMGGSYLSLSSYQERLTAATEGDIKSMEDFDKALHVHMDTIAGITSSYGALTASQFDLQKVNLKQTIDDETAALENSQKVLDRMVQKQTAEANYTAPASTALGAGIGITVPVPAGPPGQDIDQQQAKIAALSQTVRDLYAAYSSGHGTLSEFIDALNAQVQATALTDVGARAVIASIIKEADSHEVASHAVELHKAQYALLLSLLGDTKAFDDNAKDVLVHAQAVDMARESLQKYDTAALAASADAAAGILERMGREDLAERLKEQVTTQIHELQKSGQEEADRNAILLRVGVDVGEADKLFSTLKSAEDRLGTSFEDQKGKIEAAAKAINDQNGTLKISAEAVQAVIDRLGQGYARDAAEASKLRQEHELMAKGFTQEQADQAINNIKNVNLNLEGRAKLEKDLNDLIRERAALSSPQDAPQRSNIDQEILQTKQKIADLDQKDFDKIDNIIGANNKILDQLKAQITFKSGAITQDDITQAGVVARDKINQNLGPNATDADRADAKKQADDAQAAGEAAKYEAFWTQASAEATKVMDDERAKAVALYDKLLPPQDKYNEQLDRLKPLLDGSAEGQQKYNDAVVALGKLQPILEKQYKLRQQQAELDALEASSNPLDWVHAGFLEIQNEAQDTGKVVAGAFKTGFDNINHGFFELVTGQKQGWADMKSAALNFVSTLGEVAEKELMIMLISRTIGFIGSMFGGGGATTGTVLSEGSSSGSTVSAFTRHDGGMAEDGGPTRPVPVFAAMLAPRYDRGGMVQPVPSVLAKPPLAPDEHLIVAHTGERVLNRQETADYNRERQETAITSDLPRYDQGGMVGDDRPTTTRNSSYGSSPGQQITVVKYKPTFHISGFNDANLMNSMIDAAAARGHADLMRHMRNNPNSRRDLMK